MAIHDNASSPATLRVVPPDVEGEQNRQLAREHRVELRLRLATVLHATLDLADLISQFGRQLTREVGAGLLYQPPPDQGEPHHHGHSGRHRVSYRLEYDNVALGLLECSRDKRFSERELERVELMIGCLIPALRNAQRYQLALLTAVLDPMTGLGNRTALVRAVDREIALAYRHRHPAALLAIDIDYFKQINDCSGHSAGDAVLVDVAETLRRICRGSDALFRFGGEEFVALLPQTDATGATVIAERLRQAIAAGVTPYRDRVLQVTASIGVAALRRGDDMQSWFDRADQALYQAKQAGRDRVIVAELTPDALAR